jgi:hypothetical protein
MRSPPHRNRCQRRMLKAQRFFSKVSPPSEVNHALWM